MRARILAVTWCAGLLAFHALAATETAPPSPVHANGIDIAYQIMGADHRGTVLMISGAGMQLTAWPPELCQALVKHGYRVILFDNRDVGLSTKFDAAGAPDFAAVMQAAVASTPAPLPYTLYDMARDTIGLMDALSIRKAHVVGVSMGGIIAQIVAAKFPEHTLSLTSMMAGDGKPGLPIIAKPERMAQIPPSGPDSDRKAYFARQVAVWHAIGSPAYPPDDATLTAWIERDMARL